MSTDQAASLTGEAPAATATAAAAISPSFLGGTCRWTCIMPRIGSANQQVSQPVLPVKQQPQPQPQPQQSLLGVPVSS